MLLNFIRDAVEGRGEPIQSFDEVEEEGVEGGESVEADVELLLDDGQILGVRTKMQLPRGLLHITIQITYQNKYQNWLCK